MFNEFGNIVCSHILAKIVCSCQLYQMIDGVEFNDFSPLDLTIFKSVEVSNYNGGVIDFFYYHLLLLF